MTTKIFFFWTTMPQCFLLSMEGNMTEIFVYLENVQGLQFLNKFLIEKKQKVNTIVSYFAKLINIKGNTKHHLMTVFLHKDDKMHLKIGFIVFFNVINDSITSSNKHDLFESMR